MKLIRSGWWVNKAPSVRQLIFAGAVVSFALFVLAASIDLFGGKKFKDDHPFFGAVAGDLFKASLIGTLAALVLDDWRGWATAWRALRPEIPRLAGSVSKLHAQLISAIGLSTHLEIRRPFSPQELYSVRSSLQTISAWLGEIYSASSDFVQSRYRVSFLGDDPSSIPVHPLSSWDELLSVLERSGLAVPLAPDVVEGPLVASAVEDVQGCLTAITPALSVSLQREASRIIVALGDLTEIINRVNRGLIELSSQRRVDEPTAVDLGIHFSRLFLQIFLLESFMAQIESESETGRPVNRRTA